jgi:hypothetical protein
MNEGRVTRVFGARPGSEQELPASDHQDAPDAERDVDEVDLAQAAAMHGAPSSTTGGSPLALTTPIFRPRAPQQPVVAAVGETRAAAVAGTAAGRTEPREMTPVVDEIEVELAPNPLDLPMTDDIRHLLSIKVDEFRLLGYGEVSVPELWAYFRGQVRRRPQNLHDLVNAVLTLQPQAFMNFAMQQVLRDASSDKHMGRM